MKDWEGWVAAGAVVVLGFLLTPATTEAGEIPSKVPPTDFADLAAVAKRLDEVIQLYRMGYIDAQKASDEVDVMAVAVLALRPQDPLLAESLTHKLKSFEADLI